MITTATRPVAATLSGDKILLRGPYNDQACEFYRSLPGGVWNRSKLCWQCEFTPAAAWRVTSQCPVHVEADESIHEAARRFYDPVLRPVAARQPEIQIGSAWIHQAAAYAFAYDRPATLLNAWMGTGKSRVAVNLADNWNCRRVLVLCPVAVLGVWRREVAKHSPREWLATILDAGTAAKKAATVKLDCTLAEARGVPLCIVVNYESAWREPLAAELLRADWDLIICDESHRIKTPTSACSKFCGKLGKKPARKLALSGTPMAHGPLDIFGQFRFLDRGIFGDSWHRFRNEFAISGPFGADHIVGFKNQATLAQRMALITYEIGRDVLDLPEAQHVDIPITLEKKSLELYREIEAESVADVAAGRITAANGLVQLLRLQQITGGFVKTDDEQIAEVGTEKADALEDLLEDVAEPVVVCCRFRHDLDLVQRVTERLKRTYGELSGRRHDLTPQATMPDGIDVMGVQIQAGGAGIDLTRARICVLFSVGYSLGEYEQFLARVHRPGQSRSVMYYHLIAEKTVDRVVYDALSRKREIINEVLSYLRGDSETGENKC